MDCPPLRFRRHQRLRRNADFSRIFRQGSRARSERLVVVALDNGLAHSRLGLSVGKRIWKSAVRRNRVRRVFREAFRLEQHELPAGFDLILIPARPRLEPRLDEVRADLVHLARKARRRLEAKRAEAG